MNLPSLKNHELQLRLFSEPIGNHGSVRTVLGYFAEELTARLFHADRFNTDSRCKYCPDLVTQNDVFLECKTMGRSKSTLIYEGRLEKDYDFSRSHTLLYVIWHHKTNTKLPETVTELQSAFLKSMQSIYIMEFHHVYYLAKKSPLVRLNSKYGKHSNAKCYGSGYRIPLKAIQSSPHLRFFWERSTNLF